VQREKYLFFYWVKLQRMADQIKKTALMYRIYSEDRRSSLYYYCTIIRSHTSRSSGTGPGTELVFQCSLLLYIKMLMLIHEHLAESLNLVKQTRKEQKVSMVAPFGKQLTQDGSTSVLS
jgi:hypothetical protein